MGHRRSPSPPLALGPEPWERQPPAGDWLWPRPPFAAALRPRGPGAHGRHAAQLAAAAAAQPPRIRRPPGLAELAQREVRFMRPPGLAALAQREAARAPPAGELRGPRLDALLQGIPTPLRLGQRAAARAAAQALEPPADGSAAGVREEAMPAVADPGAAAADIPPPVRDSMGRAALSDAQPFAMSAGPARLVDAGQTPMGAHAP
ncbi:unnamed protein product [Prorocentrum cordatum]|uniref:Uncharacterized protein n=1 Tax=Prorocentrum cordatum TaxID=2364126 RepID=A0ABN9QX53_9DINO|nr:unnamed protein product [Polarella glacialis]